MPGSLVRGREPEIELALLGTRSEVGALPAVVLDQAGPGGSGVGFRVRGGLFPLLGLMLVVAPAVLVVHAHDVDGICLGELSLVVDDQQVVVVLSRCLRSAVVGACEARGLGT